MEDTDFMKIINICAKQEDVKKEVRDNHDENKWWPTSVSDYRKRLLIAGLSTRISYNMIGTYQKVIGYSSSAWDKQLFKRIYRKYEKNKYISGEYLTYTCVDKEKMLIKK